MSVMLTEGPEAAGKTAAKIDAIIKKMSEAEVQMGIDQGKATVNVIAELVRYLVQLELQLEHL